MKPRELADFIELIISQNKTLCELSDRGLLIVNPLAGGLSKRASQAAIKKEIIVQKKNIQSTTKNNYPCKKITITKAVTRYPGHATSHAESYIANCLSQSGNRRSSRFWLISAGGDGTAQEILVPVMKLAEEDRNNCTFFGLAFGTGNDTTDGRTFSENIHRLLTYYAMQKCLANIHQSRWLPSCLLGFYIMSIGIDAFIAQLNNKPKSIFP